MLKNKDGPPEGGVVEQPLGSIVVTVEELVAESANHFPVLQALRFELG